MQKIFSADKDPFTDIIGQEAAKRQLRSALLMDRNIVIFGPPGIGKTTLAKNIAKLLPTITVNDCDFNCIPSKPVCPSCRKPGKKKTRKIGGEQRFVRVQGSPDLTAEDLLGDIDPLKAMKYGSMSIEAFSPGKIFKANNGVLFFDELNRCPEKLQNALLQVLEEGKATIGSYDVDIMADFIFIATMNPNDINTEKLSDMLLDRFDVVYMSYPETAELEMQVIRKNAGSIVKVPEHLLALIVRLIRELRHDDKLEKVPSVRASIGLYERSQSNAYLMGRKSVEFEDIRDAVVSVLAHRIRLKPSVKYLESQDDYVRKAFERFIENNYPDIASAKMGGDG